MSRYGSQRLHKLGSSIFAEVAQWKAEALAAGQDVIDLSIGSPDTPPTREVRQRLAEAALRDDAYLYPGSRGSLKFLQSAARWLEWRFGVHVSDPETQVLSLMGSQDGLGHLTLAFCDPGDVVLLPNPGYPVYEASVALAGADVETWWMPLRAEHGYMPQLQDIPADIAKRARMMVLNYPSNPLSAVASSEFMAHAVAWCRAHDVLLVHDNAYSEMAFDGVRPPSVLEVDGAFDVAIEFHSTSKSFHLAGARIAFACGNAEAVGALARLKANIDYGVFLPVQEAAVQAYEADMAGIGLRVGPLYERRRDVFMQALAESGWPMAEFVKPLATMFCWLKLPEAVAGLWTSRTFAQQLLAACGVAVVPGDAFGSEGEGFVRLALVQQEERLVEAARRLGHFYTREVGM